MTQAVLADHRTARIDSKLRATLDLLEKVTLHPQELTPGDVAPLKALGLTREAVESALLVAFCFNQIARLADAFGWEVLDEDGFNASAANLLSHGYLMPFRTEPRG